MFKNLHVFFCIFLVFWIWKIFLDPALFVPDQAK